MATKVSDTKLYQVRAPIDMADRDGERGIVLQCLSYENALAAVQGYSKMGVAATIEVDTNTYEDIDR